MYVYAVETTSFTIRKMINVSTCIQENMLLIIRVN